MQFVSSLSQTIASFVCTLRLRSLNISTLGLILNSPSCDALFKAISRNAPLIISGIPLVLPSRFSNFSRETPITRCPLFFCLISTSSLRWLSSSLIVERGTDCLSPISASRVRTERKMSNASTCLKTITQYNKMAREIERKEEGRGGNERETNAGNTARSQRFRVSSYFCIISTACASNVSLIVVVVSSSASSSAARHSASSSRARVRRCADGGVFGARLSTRRRSALAAKSPRTCS